MERFLWQEKIKYSAGLKILTIIFKSREYSNRHLGKILKSVAIDKKENTLLIIAVLVLLLLLGFWQGFGYMGEMMFFGPIFMILVLVLIVWLIVSLSEER